MMHKKYILPFRIITCFISALIAVIITVIVGRCMFPTKNINIINKYSHEYGVDAAVVLSFIKAESNFNESAQSHAGAKGLMQLTDDTFLYCTVNAKIENADNIYDVETNIHAGLWYLSYLLKKYDNNLENAIAAYNAGSATVDKWLKNEKYSDDGIALKKIPYGETQRHINKIKKYVSVYKALYPWKLK